MTRSCAFWWCEQKEDNGTRQKNWETTHSRGREDVPASWPRGWRGPETFYARCSLACSFLGGKGPSALCSPRCTCPEKSISRDFNRPKKYADVQPKRWLAFLHKPPSRIFWSLWTCRQSPPSRSIHTSVLVPALSLPEIRGNKGHGNNYYESWMTSTQKTQLCSSSSV